MTQSDLRPALDLTASPDERRPVAPRRRSFFGHPWTLRYLTSLAFFDQFSYYGMQAILLIYLYYSVAQGGLEFAQLTAIGVVGAYSGAAYLSGSLSGWLADRVFGSERTLFYAACAVTAGHLALAVLPGAPGLFAGLVLVAIGSGGIKTNTANVIGQTYPEADPRRDAGFSIFYTAAQVGALCGPILVGVVQASWGFHFGFGVAGVGMAIGLIHYATGRRYLSAAGKVAINPLSRRERFQYAAIALAVVAAFTALIFVGAVTVENIPMVTTAAAAICMLVIIVGIFRNRTVTPVERRRVTALLPWLVLMIAYTAVFLLSLTLLTVFADTAVDRTIGGFEMPVAWAGVMVPAFFVIVSIPIAVLWTKLGDRQPTTPVKLCIGFALSGAGLLAFLTMTGREAGEAPLGGLLLAAVLIALSEVFVIPLLMSLATLLGPRASRAQAISLVTLSAAVGFPLASVIASWFDSAQASTAFFAVGGSVTIVGALLFVLFVPWTVKRMHTVA